MILRQVTLISLLKEWFSDLGRWQCSPPRTWLP